MVKLQNICDVKSGKKLLILDFLIDNPGWHTTVSISKELSLSLYTVTKYLKEISGDLIDQDITLNLEYNNKKEVQLYYKDLSIYRTYKREVFKENWSVHLLMKLFLGYQVPYVQFIQENYISESSYRRTIASIKRELSNFNITVKSTKGVNTLVGDEATIRLVGVKMFWDLFHGEIWPFKEVSKKELSRSLMATFRNLENETIQSYVNHINIQQTLYRTAIQIIRSRKGWIFPVSSTLKREVKIIEKILPTNLTFLSNLPKTETHFFYLQLLCAPRFLNTKMGTKIIEKSINESTLVSKINETFMKRFEQNFFKLSKKEEIKIRTAIYGCHVFFLLYPKFKGRTNTDKFFEDFPILRKNTQKLGQKMTDEFFEIGFEANQSLIKNYMLIFGQIKPLSYCENKVKLLINTDLGILYENIISENLRSTLKQTFNVQIFTSISEKQDDYDLTVATSKVPDIAMDFDDRHIIYINEVPTPKDYFNIYQFIKKYIERES